MGHGNHTLSVATQYHDVTFANVTFGDVFLCGGQSNMDSGANSYVHFNQPWPILPTPDIRLFIPMGYDRASTPWNNVYTLEAGARQHNAGPRSTPSLSLGLTPLPPYP